MAIIICVLLGWLWAGPVGLFMGLQLGCVIYFFQRLMKRLAGAQSTFQHAESFYEQYTPPKREPAYDMPTAYTTLGISPNATDDEVKKAYRRMAMEYHPDKQVNASEQEKQAAAEKFRAANKAYEHIKQQRNLK